MAEIVPTILADSPAQYKQMIERVQPFVKRIHVDICDGQFADNATVGLAQVYGIAEVELDLHLMQVDPGGQFENAVSLKPSLIIYHFESTGDLAGVIKQTQELGIKAGLALLPQTPVDIAAELIEKVDHVLIFTGLLGHNGGEFQANQLEKVAQIREIKTNIEISVDGGVNEESAKQAAESGVDVLYTGGFIQSSPKPKEAYEKLAGAVA